MLPVVCHNKVYMVATGLKKHVAVSTQATTKIEQLTRPIELRMRGPSIMTKEDHLYSNGDAIM